MTMPRETLTILMADDDRDDCLMVSEAFREARILNERHFVSDGEDLMDYLYRRGRHADKAGQRLPGLILLDLNMPRLFPGSRVMESRYIST